MKIYIKAGRDSDDAIARECIQMIKDALVGYEYEEGSYTGFPISIVDVTDITYRTKIADRPPYTKYLMLSGYAITDAKYSDHEDRGKNFNYLANEIQNIIDETIPNSACTKPSLYGDAIKFNVTAIID